MEINQARRFAEKRADAVRYIVDRQGSDAPHGTDLAFDQAVKFRKSPTFPEGVGATIANVRGDNFLDHRHALS